MQLEVGKYYRSRHGKKFYVAMENPHAPPTSVWRFVGFRADSEGEAIGWGWDGNFNRQSAGDLDLIAEWVDEPSVDGAWKLYEPISLSAPNPDIQRAFCAGWVARTQAIPK